MANQLPCGCFTNCRCQSTVSDCLIIDYNYVVDPMQPYRKFFNQGGTPEQPTSEALRTAQETVIGASGMGKACTLEFCKIISIRNNGGDCPPKCWQALIDRIIPLIVQYAIYYYVETVGHDNNNNYHADKLKWDNGARQKMSAHYSRQAKNKLDNADLKSFLYNTRVCDIDSDQPSNTSRCFTCLPVENNGTCTVSTANRNIAYKPPIYFTQ